MDDLEGITHKPSWAANPGRKEKTMTIKEMFEKVETYNEIGEMLGREEKVVLWVDFGSRMLTFKDYKGFKNWLEEDIIDKLAEAVLECDRFEFGKAQVVSIVDRWGERISKKIYISAGKDF